MKKLVILLISLIVLIAAFCFLNRPLRNQNTLSGSPVLYTLNGIRLDRADQMVNRFLSDKTIKHHETSILFTGAVFHSIDSLLIANNADGFRIYFAKDSLGNENIVLISTFDGGVIASDASNPQKHTHIEFYQRSAPYFKSSLNKQIVPSYGKVRGAFLFTTPNCPPDGQDGCDESQPHYISCHRADSMVKAFVKRDPTANPRDTINATSEWFDRGVIRSLDTILQKTPNSGLRIYFAQCLKKDKLGVKRHGFVLISTKSKDSIQQDSYDCFKLYLLRPLKRLTDSEKKLNPFFGGTDNGEQCPYNCAVVTWP